MSVTGWSMERRLVHLACPRTKPHLALQNRVNEKREKRGILHDWKESHPLIKLQATLTTTPPSPSSPHSTLNFGKIKGIPSSYPVPSRSSSSSSLAIAPNQPSIRKQPPRVSVIERMTKSRGIQIATRLKWIRTVLEKARNEEN
ncbi:uncharacterized protein MONOS_10588 [Monocercomonoides exilis]|uniref:uncharacterized protein n=1 Tax=Monocercomonoides exilis TaxID=2049356 RepID=UPI003559A754|nr:hypothetical protein MONOS_10588 [Monocercomonoides exilis]|eukprot:MONOS_10588.1-p1 / transcript=MONOS_10588.1 / gene=MONOS_10588 / organism=Monocercomonoides_exilis_PA203 / gene_product=unspecified product / transcript_product=unspecified product / location=Mono_scaffold00487:10513-11257(-) / protein_length=144 / sequence_SO=supercontig / SO=protein_coding / is_pseudo=false